MEKFVSLMEGICGVGITLSPIMGVFVYNAVGFSKTFLIFGSAMAPFALIVLLLPKPRELSKLESQDSAEQDVEDVRLRTDGGETETEREKNEIEEPAKLTYSSLVCQQRVLHPAIAGGVMNMVYGSLEPILSLRLSDYNLNENVTGAIFGVQPLAYMLSTFLIPYILPKWIVGRVIMITSLFLLAIATVFIGPFFAQ